MSPRILVVYYSRTGNTRKIADDLALALGADLEEIHDLENRLGLRGYLRSGRQAFWHKVVPLKPAQLSPECYDLIVIGTPIWNVSVASPVRAYLREHRREMKAVAFFCTCGGMGIDRVFEQMSHESGLMPVATLPVLESKLDSPGTKWGITHFVRRIQTAFTGTSKQSA